MKSRNHTKKYQKSSSHSRSNSPSSSSSNNNNNNNTSRKSSSPSSRHSSSSRSPISRSRSRSSSSSLALNRHKGHHHHHTTRSKRSHGEHHQHYHYQKPRRDRRSDRDSRDNHSSRRRERKRDGSYSSSSSSGSSVSPSKSKSRSQESSKSRSLSRRKTKKHIDKHKYEDEDKSRSTRIMPNKDYYREDDHGDRHDKNKKDDKNSNRLVINKLKRPAEDQQQHQHDQILDSHKEQWGKPDLNPQPEEEQAKLPSPEKPNFEPSGTLTKYSNAVNGAVLKFTEPPDAKVPFARWKIFPFKGDEELPVISIHNQSCYLFGKDKRISDIILENPSCSGQHAVIQFREITKSNEIGETIRQIKPYIMDLDSTNGTFLNGEKIEGARYYELRHQDVLRFGMSTRDYVIMEER